MPQNGDNDAEKLAFIKSIWIAAQPLRGSIAERYLDETRHIDVTKLPEDIHAVCASIPAVCSDPAPICPCLIALMRDPLTDEPVGIQRIALEDRDGKIEKIDRRMLGQRRRGQALAGRIAARRRRGTGNGARRRRPAFPMRTDR